MRNKIARKKKDVYLIGLGQFGLSFTYEFLEYKKELIIIESDKNKIQSTEIRGAIFYHADATNIDGLREIGINEDSHVVVAVSSNIANNILICEILIDIGVKSIISKASSQIHAKILSKIGIKTILRPDYISGKQAALISSFNVPADLSIISDEYSMMQTIVVNDNIVGKTLSVLQISAKFNCNIILIIRQGKSIFPQKNTILKINDKLYIICENKVIHKVNKFFN